MPPIIREAQKAGARTLREILTGGNGGDPIVRPSAPASALNISTSQLHCFANNTEPTHRILPIEHIQPPQDIVDIAVAARSIAGRERFSITNCFYLFFSADSTIQG
jgi:hypothetical protein